MDLGARSSKQTIVFNFTKQAEVKKASPWMFDKLLNTPLEELYYKRFLRNLGGGVSPNSLFFLKACNSFTIVLKLISF